MFYVWVSSFLKLSLPLLLILLLKLAKSELRTELESQFLLNATCEV